MRDSKRIALLAASAILVYALTSLTEYLRGG
jgi:hypothetical protein